MRALKWHFLSPYSEDYRSKGENEEKSHKMNYWLEIVFKACLLPDAFQQIITFWLAE